MQFCKERTISIEGVSLPSEKAVQSLIRRYNEFLRSSSTKVKDKVSMAYRHVLARAAWLAFQERRFDDCELFYEEAILADSSNGWLFDRYAYFLLSRGRPEEALEKASIATGLIGDDPEAWFTRGMIEARAGLTGAARTSLGRSLKNGKPKHLYLLQLAYANLNDSPPDKANARANVDESERSTPPQDPYRWKHLAEIERLRNRIGI
jgi:tetratricopeptide (TPR) repeat protein